MEKWGKNSLTHRHTHTHTHTHSNSFFPSLSPSCPEAGSRSPPSAGTWRSAAHASRAGPGGRSCGGPPSRPWCTAWRTGASHPPASGTDLRAGEATGGKTDNQSLLYHRKLTVNTRLLHLSLLILHKNRSLHFFKVQFVLSELWGITRRNVFHT